MSIYWLILIGLGISMAVGLYISTRERGRTGRLVSLGAFSEPEAMLACDRLRSQGVWADVQYPGGGAGLSIQLGSAGGYGLVVLPKDESKARGILGL